MFSGCCCGLVKSTDLKGFNVFRVRRHIGSAEKRYYRDGLWGRVERKKFVWFSILSRLLWGRLRDHRVKRKNKISLTKMIFLYSVEQRDKCGTIVYLKASQTEIKHARSYKKQKKNKKNIKQKNNLFNEKLFSLNLRRRPSNSLPIDHMLVKGVLQSPPSWVARFKNNTHKKNKWEI